MKRVTCGLATAGLLCLTPLTAAADSINEAFANGALAGQVGLYGISGKASGADREGFVGGSAALAYQTAPLQGLSLGLGAWGATRLHETNAGDYRVAIASDAIIHQAYVHYDGGGWGEITAGRYEIDLEWLNDYILGVGARVTPIENLALSFGWAQRQAVVGLDEVSEGFAQMNGNKGLYFFSGHYSPLAWLTVNPYYYHASDIYRAPGLKLTAELELMTGLDSATMLQYVRTTTPTGQDNGDFWWLEQMFAYQGVDFGAGYMQADRKAGSNIAEFGDQIPFEYGDNIFEPDAKIWYLALGYQWDALGLTAIYGHTRYDDGIGKTRGKELNLVAGYELYTNLDLELIYADVRNSSAATPDFNSISLALIYSF